MIMAFLTLAEFEGPDQEAWLLSPVRVRATLTRLPSEAVLRLPSSLQRLQGERTVIW